MKTTFRLLTATLLMVALLIAFTGCTPQEKSSYTPIPGLDTGKQVTLKIVIPNETDRALTLLANDFMAKYPNVNVTLEYMENYSDNAIRLMQEGEVDIILLRDITYKELENDDGSKAMTSDYFYDFYADAEVDLSDTNPLITGNYTHTRTDENGDAITYLYAVPLGGEVRGLFVNKTLLASLGLTVPANYPELLRCCEALRDAGYTPIQGNPSTAAVSLAIPTAARAVANDAASLEIMRSASPGVSALFEDSMSKLYELASLRYYDYKAIEENEGQFKASGEYGQSMSFLGLSSDPDTFVVSTPANNSGTVAFFPYLSSASATIKLLIEQYKLDTEFEFVPAPLNNEGEKSAVYLTPYYGLCANKNSDNLIWIREFFNFVFDEENNLRYAENAQLAPNVANAIQMIADQYGVDAEKDCIFCGTIRFSDAYNGYSPLSSGMVDVFKCSAPKYMVELVKDESGAVQYLWDDEGREYLLAGDGETKIEKESIGEEDPLRPGYAFCSFEYYMNKLEARFEKYRE